jgi:hypothetical protein
VRDINATHAGRHNGVTEFARDRGQAMSVRAQSHGKPLRASLQEDQV